MIMTGAASINVPAAIGATAKMPRPLAESQRISTQGLAAGSGFSWARAARAAAAATKGIRSPGRGSGVFARPVGGCRCRGRRADGRLHLRHRGGGLRVGLLHPGLERLDAAGEIAHDPGNLALAAKQHNSHTDNDEPVPYAKR